MAIKLEDKTPDTELLKFSDLSEIAAMIIKDRLTWSGYFVNMIDDRLHKNLLYSELAESKSDVDGQYNIYIKIIKGMYCPNQFMR